jgi:hypothetical protein
VRLAPPLVAVAESAVGDPGTAFDGVTGDDQTDAVPVPTAFLATTRKM